MVVESSIYSSIKDATLWQEVYVLSYIHSDKQMSQEPRATAFLHLGIGLPKKKSGASELNSKYIASHVTQRNDLRLIVFTAVTRNNL